MAPARRPAARRTAMRPGWALPSPSLAEAFTERHHRQCRARGVAALVLFRFTGQTPCQGVVLDGQKYVADSQSVHHQRHPPTGAFILHALEMTASAANDNHQPYRKP